LIWAEVVAAIPIIGLMVALAASGILRYYRTRNESVARQAAMWAAAAQLQRCQAGAPLDSQPPGDAIPTDVVLKTVAAPSQGSWAGFNLVTVTATVSLNERDKVSERISGYVPAEVKP
jgi:type II secretory pathway pseudopilin PulG